jgi:hypothetical protein
MVNINIEITKNHLVFLSFIAVFLIGTGIVFAYGTNNPPVFGHSASETNLGDGTNMQTWVDSVESRLGSGLDIIIVNGPDNPGSSSVNVLCPSGYKVISGGYKFIRSTCDEKYRFAVVSYPLSDRSGWRIHTECFSAKTYAICIKD